jgi:hypothetical protein
MISSGPIGGFQVKIAVLALLAIGVSVGCYLYSGAPVPASILGLDLPFMGREGVVAHDTTFYPGSDLEAVVGALVMNQFVGDVGGLCDQQGFKCADRQVIKAGTRVRVIKEVRMQNGRIDVTFAHVEIARTEGWVVASAVR